MKVYSVVAIKKHITLFSLLFISLIFSSCELQKPVKIGYVGGLTGRVAGLGIAGRDGVMLAVEEANKENGINGRSVSLIVKDDKQDVETAVRVDNELIQEGVAAIIGHMTSSMSIVGADIATKHKVLMLSPTTSTNELTEKDDYFFRLYPASAISAKKLALHAYNEMKTKSITVLYDMKNKAHTESWYLSFKDYYEAAGGSIAAAETYVSGSDVKFIDIARKIAATDTAGVFIIANAIDTAMLCQQLIKINWNRPIITSEWSATEELLEFGGKTVEGIHFYHTYDNQDDSPDFLRFRRAFKDRFGYDAGFASAHAYDSARVIIASLRKNADPSKLRETITDTGIFMGLQGELNFNRYGDIDRKHILMTIHNGKFQAI
ncbi:MAG: ABC transporter substrate-binding protein [Nitrospira sp.]|nr:ABC transporter substrate-binding protein [bacterium]MBL7049405.1 ABC transporter substrate-binding protein [Nitrospira sp.]